MNSNESIIGGGFGPSSVGKGLVALGLSAAFIWLTVRGVDLAEVHSQFQLIEMGAMLPVLISLVLIFVYKAFRWQYQMFPLKRITFKGSLSAILIGYMANNAVPLRGGDVLRAHVLARQENIGTAAVFATVALERIFDILSLLTVSLVIVFMIPLPNWLWNSVVILGTAILGGATSFVAVRRFPNLLKKWGDYWRSCVPRKVQELLTVCVKQVRLGIETARGKVRLINLYMLAVGEWVLWGLLVNYSLRMLGIHLSIAAVMCTVIATNLAVVLPAAPGYIGVFHYAVMATLGFYQFDKSIAFSGAVILHAIFVIPVSLVGFIFFVREWLKPKGIAI